MRGSNADGESASIAFGVIVLSNGKTLVSAGGYRNVKLRFAAGQVVVFSST